MAGLFFVGVPLEDPGKEEWSGGASLHIFSFIKATYTLFK